MILTLAVGWLLTSGLEQAPCMPSNALPARQLWVSPFGSDRNDGSSRDSALATIQAAADRAAPGTAVMVAAGLYEENVKVKKSGSSGAPIWFLSADGPRQARIRPVKEDVATIHGRGTDHVIIQDFEIEGPSNRHGLEFTQAGHDFTDLVDHLHIKGNLVRDAGVDGIKVAQAGHLQVVDNVVIGGSEEGIDLVTIWQSCVVCNEVTKVAGRSGITVKGGATGVLVANNHVHDVAVDGILIGGWTDPELLHIFKGYEARHVTVTGNLVESVEKRALNFIGAHDSFAIRNVLVPQNSYHTIVNIEADPINDLKSRNITLAGNQVTSPSWLAVAQDQDDGLLTLDNRVGPPPVQSASHAACPWR